ncbi:MAG: carboxy terminal-processing peptidase [Bacteroidales bacterium]
MKSVKFVLPVLVLGIFAFTLFHSGKKEKVLMEILTKSMEAGHYQPVKIDKGLSVKVYDFYLKSLDYNKRYLIKEDIDKLEKYKSKIDEEIKQVKFEFFDLSVELINKRIKETEAIFQEILDKPFDFEKNEYFESDPEKMDFPKNEKERYERWRQLLKYQTLVKLSDLMTIQENAIKDKDTSYKVLEFSELEKNARDKVKADYKELYRRINQLTETDRLDAYLNAFLGSYDPHTEYMEPKDKERFDYEFSGQLEGIGAQLQEQNGYIKVASLVPGSPSWKQGILKPGDIILKVAQGDGEPLSIVDMRIDEAVRYIRGKKGTEVRLTVKKPDASIIVISIIRDIVVLEETYAKSAILKMEGSSKRIGYIFLPSFYSNFENRNGRRCATDVEHEIEKLKKEDVDGIILDLRNNGGGSLMDAVEMAGLFIKDGPVVQVKSRGGSPTLLKDNDSRIQYDGEMLVLVNTQSASASEIMAAAMQDYGRAVIVGAPSTFGKGTVQRFIELDDFVNDSYSDVKPLGSLKITTQKFYRINGGATQLKGVIPDIILPDIFQAIEIGEKELDNPMVWDEISPASYKKWPIPVTNLQELKDKSNSRVLANNTFNLVKENSARMLTLKNQTKYTLNLKSYKLEQEKLNSESKKFDKMLDSKTKLDVIGIAEDMMKMETDSTKTIAFKAWMSNLKKDAYLEEAVNIIEEVK